MYLLALRCTLCHFNRYGDALPECFAQVLCDCVYRGGVQYIPYKVCALVAEAFDCSLLFDFTGNHNRKGFHLLFCVQS